MIGNVIQMQRQTWIIVTELQYLTIHYFVLDLLKPCQGLTSHYHNVYTPGWFIMLYDKGVTLAVCFLVMSLTFLHVI